MSANVHIVWRPEATMELARGKMRAGIKAAADFVASDAKRRAPHATGRLRKAIRPKVTTERGQYVGYVVIGKAAFYGTFHELGTSKLRARPFLRPALVENRAEIMRLIKGAT